MRFSTICRSPVHSILANPRPPLARRALQRVTIGFLSTMLVLVVCQIAAAAEPPQRLAFPNAEGYGRFAEGGRGGRIILVTNLNDSGEGTLRACVESTGARNCVFRVGGAIQLTASLVVGAKNHSLSILGQTAPGDGITLAVETPNANGMDTPLAIVKTHDVIVRHLRVRARLPNSVKNVHAIVIEDSRRIYIDHVSTSWATDENISTYSNTTELTIANSIFAEGLIKHSKCTLLGADPRLPQKLTFMRNLCVSNRDRNPDNNHYAGSCVDIINNVFYNAKTEWAEVFSQFPGGTPISFIGNYFKAGPSTKDTSFAITSQTVESSAAPKIFEKDNAVWAPRAKRLVLLSPGTERHIVGSPPCPLSVFDILTSTAAYQHVRAQSGAFPRDTLDQEWINQLGSLGAEGTGRMTSTAGDLPILLGGNAYGDKDRNGIADSVETKTGVDEAAADPWANSTGSNEWSRFDAFMEWLSEERIAGRYPL